MSTDFVRRTGWMSRCALRGTPGDQEGIDALIIGSPQCVVMEATGGYPCPPRSPPPPVAVVNPRQVRNSPARKASSRRQTVSRRCDRPLRGNGSGLVAAARELSALAAAGHDDGRIAAPPTHPAQAPDRHLALGAGAATRAMGSCRWFGGWRFRTTGTVAWCALGRFAKFRLVPTWRSLRACGSCSRFSTPCSSITHMEPTNHLTPKRGRRDLPPSRERRGFFGAVTYATNLGAGAATAQWAVVVGLGVGLSFGVA